MTSVREERFASPASQPVPDLEPAPPSRSGPAADLGASRLLLLAVGVLGRHHAEGRYPSLTGTQRNQLVHDLSEAAVDPNTHVTGSAALVLARRLLDDDDPQLSELWPRD